jgi:hypothetical protein
MVLVYANCYYSLLLLSLVVRDYQKFVYGMPSRTLPAEQSELLRQAVFDGDIAGAIQLYRRTIPDVSLVEGREFVVKLAAELKAKHPEQFQGLKLRDLNWRLMGLCLVAGLGVCAGLWMIMPPVAPAARLQLFAGMFLFGASGRLLASTRLKGASKRFPVMLGMFVGIELALEAMKALHGPSQGVVFIFGGFLFGICMIASGLTPKRRKSTPGQPPLTDVSPPL